MGVPCERFVDRQHELFKCSICLEVSHPAIITNNCQHIFCQPCFQSIPASVNRTCPECRSVLRDPKSFPIDGVSKRLYLDLKIKCLSDECKHVSDMSSFQNHDVNCPFLIITCPDCGFQSGPATTHSCTGFLKTVINEKNETIVRKDETINQKNEIINKMEEEIKRLKERCQQNDAKIQQDGDYLNQIKSQCEQYKKKVAELEAKYQTTLPPSKSKQYKAGSSAVEAPCRQQNSMQTTSGDSHLQASGGQQSIQTKSCDVRIILIGAHNVGKTTLAHSICKEPLIFGRYESTIKPRKFSTYVDLPDKLVSVELIEFPGSDDFRRYGDHSQVMQADLIVLLYDNAEYELFQFLDQWMEVLRKIDPFRNMSICGVRLGYHTRSDTVTLDELNKWCKDNQITNTYDLRLDGFSNIRNQNFVKDAVRRVLNRRLLGF